MSVNVHRDTNVAVPHQVLQRFRVHLGSRLIAALGVASYVRAIIRQAPLQLYQLVPDQLPAPNPHQ